MTASELPDELLHNIFRRLDGRFVLLCRAVCHRWRDAVETLSDKDWKTICSDHRQSSNYPAYYEKVRKKYSLSWRDTYRAVNSWSNISSAKINIQELSRNVQRCKVLPNGIVACLQNNRHKHFIVDQDTKYDGFSDTIVYYNTESFKECGREEFDFAFSSLQFDENEYFLAMIQFNCFEPKFGKLCIILKENKNEYTVGRLAKYKSYTHYYSQFTLIGKEVYFKNEENYICVSRLEEENGVTTLNTVTLSNALFGDDVVEFHYNDSVEYGITHFCNHRDQLHILTNDGTIYIHSSAGYQEYTHILKNSSENIHALRTCGFDLTSINNALKYYVTNILLFMHCDVILTTNELKLRSFNKLKLFYAPHFIKQKRTGPYYHLSSTNSLPEIVLEKPTKVIDMTNELIGKAKLQQIDFIETGHNHKLVVVCDNKVLIVELNPGYLPTTLKPRCARNSALVQKRRLNKKVVQKNKKFKT